MTAIIAARRYKTDEEIDEELRALTAAFERSSTSAGVLLESSDERTDEEIDAMLEQLARAFEATREEPAGAP